jgi:dihydrofolate reductase
VEDPGIHPIAAALNTQPKYVASTTPTDPKWSDTSVLSDDLATAIADLKAKPEGELQVHGSGALIRRLLDNQLVDEITLFVCPWSSARGARLFPDTGPDAALDLVESQSTPKGVTIQIYRPSGRPQYGTDDKTGSATPTEMAAINAFNDRLEAESHWVFAAGLASPSTATVIDNRGGEAVFTDGPLPGVEGVPRRLLDHRGPRPRRGAQARRRGVEALQSEGRGAAVPGQVRVIGVREAITQAQQCFHNANWRRPNRSGIKKRGSPSRS